MDVEAIFLAATGKHTSEHVIQAVRDGLYPVAPRLQRVQVWTESHATGFLCCLQAWAERGRTLAVERRAGTLLAAVDEAVTALAVALSRGRSSDTITRPYASRVLLALHTLDPSAPSSSWARLLTNALAGALDVCRVVPGAPSPASLASGREWLQATRQLLSAQRDTRAWCSEALPEAVLTDRAIAGSGDWIDELSTLARRKGSDWLVVPADGMSGRAAAALARAAGCPVLVARAPTTRSTLLVSVAPDGNDAARLASAAELSEALNAPVLAFRNIFERAPGERSAPESERLAESWRSVQAQRHPLEAGRRVPPLDVLLGCDPDGTRAVLSQALREDAEMIIIGASDGASSDGAADSLAASVAERAARSVLLVPTAGAASDERSRRTPSRSCVVPAGASGADAASGAPPAGASSEAAPARVARPRSGAVSR